MVGFVTPILCGCPNLILITLLKVVASFIMMIIWFPTNDDGFPYGMFEAW